METTVAKEYRFSNACNWICRFALTFAVSIAMAATSLASTITLQWDPVTAPDLAGYKVYYSTGADAPFTGTGAVQGTSPVDVYSTTTTITGLDPGQPYYFAVTAYNAAGVESPYSNIVAVTELIPPSVALTSPGNNSAASGTVSVTASATDNVGVAKIEFYVNGTLQTTETGTPYVYSWDTSSAPAGSYTVMAKAYDAAGNAGADSVVVNVVHDTTAPAVSLAAPGNGATIHGIVPVTANATDDVGVTRVELYANGALLSAGNVPPYSYNWDTSAVANGSYTLSAKAYDAAGNIGTSSTIQVTVLNDLIPPTAAIAQPAANSTVSGTVTVTASASDNISVARVEFYVNGALQLTAVTAPYSFQWNTSSLSNGSYTLSATAYDGAGNAGRSAGVTVNVFNDTAAPVVTSFTMPQSSTTLTVPVTIAATDNVSITGYFISESSATPAAGSAGWLTTRPTSFTFAASGARTAYLWAKDAAGNVSAATSASTTISIPDTTAPVITSLLPANGARIGTNVVVSATATDNVGISRMQLYIDGALQMETSTSSFSWNLNTKAYQKGSHVIMVKAYDAAKNVTSKAVTVYK